MSEPVIGDREQRWIQDCLASGYVSAYGPMVDEFEQRFARCANAEYAVATVSGTAALHVSLRALDIQPGDYVAVSDLTFIASVNPVLYSYARPVLIDVDPATWCMDPEALRAACAHGAQQGTPIRAVIPVHVYGCACDMTALQEAAGEFGLAVVEDATEALGTTFSGRQVGTFGTFGCFSFNGNKMITCGGGGMVVTASAAQAERVRYFVNQAYDDGGRYLHGDVGYNYRLSNLSAALGLAQLSRLDDLLRKKRRWADGYRTLFADSDWIQCPPEPEAVRNCYWLFSAVLDTRRRREQWRADLAGQGIPSRRFFMPLHRQPFLPDRVWSRINGPAQAVQHSYSDELTACGINLPSSPTMTETQFEQILNALRLLMDQAG
jgi:perosamine synthetase